MTRNVLTIATAVCLGILGSVDPGLSHADADHKGTCTFLKKRLSTAPFLLGYELETIVDDRGRQRVPNVDVDGDGLIDVVYWQCPNQGSAVPADPCQVRVEFQGGGEMYLEEFGIAPIRYRAQVIAVAASFGPKRQAGSGQAWILRKNGPVRICDSL